MKTKRVLLAVGYWLLAVGQISAQENIKSMFDKIIATKGVTSTTATKSQERDTEGNLVFSTIIHDIKVGKNNFKLFDQLKEAFDADAEKATTVSICYGNEEKESLNFSGLQTNGSVSSNKNTTSRKVAKMQSKGDSLIYNGNVLSAPEGSEMEKLMMRLPGAEIDDEGNIKINGKPVKKIILNNKVFNGNRRWEITQKNGNNIRLGDIPNSTYFLMTFTDKDKPDYRTVYAVEWWDGDEGIRQGRLIYSYGEKPKSLSVTVNSSPDDIQKYFSDLNLQNPQEVMKKLEEMGQQPDILTNWQAIQKSFNTKPQDIPFNGDTDTWMHNAMNHLKHLSNSDWHRLFGLLTEKMVNLSNRLDKNAHEDMVVAAGIILDLCKNADQLDEDEREVSARRLTDVAERFDNDKNQYIYDLLMLGAKKLRK